MTQSPSESETVDQSSTETEASVHPLQDYADSVGEALGGDAAIHFDSIKVTVAPENWVSAHSVARDELDLVFFSWLSAIDWSNETESGDPLSEEVEERIELLSSVGDLTVGRRVTISTELSHDEPAIESLVEVYAGANWHEREAAEMFGIDFLGHPELDKLYLPESFIGHPLRKDYALLSREVKPWPGTVDVESMPEKAEPTTENPET